ncbi:YjzD family protein [Ureibacillus sp. NPDC094379]
MQYIMSFVWSFLLVSMLTYVVSSVLGAHYSFANGAIISLIFAVLVLIIAAVIPNGPSDTAEHH